MYGLRGTAAKQELWAEQVLQVRFQQWAGSLPTHLDCDPPLFKEQEYTPLWGGCHLTFAGVRGEWGCAEGQKRVHPPYVTGGKPGSERPET